MSDNNFARLARAAEEYDLHNAPTRHSRQTPACPSLARLTREHYHGLSADLQAHLATCEHCRSLRGRLLSLDRQDAAQALLVYLVARQAVSQFPKAAHFATTVRELPLRRLDFEDDLELHGALLLSEDRHWLDIIHDRLPAGTLLRAKMEGGAAPTWERFAVLRPGLGKPIARLCLEETLGSEERRLSVAVVKSPAEFGPEDADLLRESVEAARREEPRALPVWRQWAASALSAPDLPEEVRAVLAETAALPAKP
jgi:hypothetical protein